jgi:hypothetical protein
MKLLQSQNVKRTIAKSASIISGDQIDPTAEKIPEVDVDEKR